MSPKAETLSEQETLIRQLAYELWEKEGRPEGREREHWEQASRTLEVKTATTEEKAVRLGGGAAGKGRRGERLRSHAQA